MLSILTSLASIANIGTIFTVIVCLAAMIIFIRQFHLFEFEPAYSSVVHVERPVLEKPLLKVNLPFSLKLGTVTFHNDDSTLGVYSTSYFPCVFIATRDVAPEELHLLIHQPWIKFKQILEIDAQIWPNILHHSNESVHEVKPFSLTSPQSENVRSTYAFVTFHLRIDEEYSIEDPGAVVTLIHLPDKYCNSPAVTLCQYLKFKDDRLLNLKPLYSSENEAPEELEKSNSDCVVCWSLPATHVLLPCRHACLCSQCFKRIDNCPVCRTRVISYFSV